MNPLDDTERRFVEANDRALAILGRERESLLRASWEEIKKNDWVTVSWKMIDKPRKAYKVMVKPPKADKAEDE